LRGLSVRPNKSSSYWGGLTDPATENGRTGNDCRAVPPLREPIAERGKANPRRVSPGGNGGSFDLCGGRPEAPLAGLWTAPRFLNTRRWATPPGAEAWGGISSVVGRLREPQQTFCKLRVANFTNCLLTFATLVCYPFVIPIS
jgi:hypothetical protein